MYCLLAASRAAWLFVCCSPALLVCFVSRLLHSTPPPPYHHCAITLSFFTFSPPPSLLHSYAVCRAMAPTLTEAGHLRIGVFLLTLSMGTTNALCYQLQKGEGNMTAGKWLMTEHRSKRFAVCAVCCLAELCRSALLMLLRAIASQVSALLQRILDGCSSRKYAYGTPPPSTPASMLGCVTLTDPSP